LRDQNTISRSSQIGGISTSSGSGIDSHIRISSGSIDKGNGDVVDVSDVTFHISGNCDWLIEAIVVSPRISKRLSDDFVKVGDFGTPRTDEIIGDMPKSSR